MKKIDAHLHLVRDLASYKGSGRSNALGNGMVVWDDGFKTRLFPEGWGDDSFRAEAARKVMREHDVEKAVLLQGSLYGFQNYYSWQVAKADPDHFIAAFSVDPFAGEAEKIVKRQVEELGFRAIKLEVSQAGGLMGYHVPFDLAEDPRLTRIFEYISSYPGFVVTIDYGDLRQASHQPLALARLARRYPDLDFVLCHLSFPLPGRLDELEKELDLLAPLANVSFDLAAMQDIASERTYPYPFCQQAVSLAKEAVGAGRLLWGSDGPWSATFNDYGQLYSWLEDSGIFSEKELTDICFANAERIYFKPEHTAALKGSHDPAVEEGV
ncbi:amidohydrolase [Lactobacillus nasalidis]|uniref:Amidohydrolase n=1 Tax=Lactobacillus nasalidis TaxID=2797258 RepID=A0ABQ3W4Z3_9LACO|nr:amidohydrolase family protein [Lactobacillus nasalidis]GHV98258.1 amidohydrolase [Lactobacillus nasalidis]GHV98863.1 amidohydrolase [Lactobacillus nasalidis]GHW00546.1 amidohydrolase [Lactobacillus nasalidis]